MKVGSTIKRLRKQKVMTLEDMAKLTGIQSATLSRIENDLMDGSLNTFMLIAGGLDMKLRYSHLSRSHKQQAVDTLSGMMDAICHSNPVIQEMEVNSIWARK